MDVSYEPWHEKNISPLHLHCLTHFQPDIILRILSYRNRLVSQSEPKISQEKQSQPTSLSLKEHKKIYFLSNN